MCARICAMETIAEFSAKEGKFGFFVFPPCREKLVPRGVGVIFGSFDQPEDKYEITPGIRRDYY